MLEILSFPQAANKLVNSMKHVKGLALAIAIVGHLHDLIAWVRFRKELLFGKPQPKTKTGLHDCTAMDAVTVVFATTLEGTLFLEIDWVSKLVLGARGDACCLANVVIFCYLPLKGTRSPSSALSHPFFGGGFPY